MPKIVWRICSVPTGRYRSFERRGWPMAYHGKDGPIAATISCEDDYCPRDVKTGNHQELTVRITDHSVRPWKWKVARTKCKTLAEAKALVARILAQNPSFAPSTENGFVVQSIRAMPAKE